MINVVFLENMLETDDGKEISFISFWTSEFENVKFFQVQICHSVTFVTFRGIWMVLWGLCSFIKCNFEIRKYKAAGK